MRLQYSPRADRDLNRLYQFLTNNAAALETADAAIEAIARGARTLLENPAMGTNLEDGTGRQELYIPFGNHNYTLRYVFDRKSQTVRILRIWHSREDYID